jgi:hypothetical protein
VRRADNLTTFGAESREIWEPERPGTLWACNRPVQGLVLPGFDPGPSSPERVAIPAAQPRHTFKNFCLLGR